MTARGWLSRVLVVLVLMSLGGIVPTHALGHFDDNHDRSGSHGRHDSNHCSLCLLAGSLTPASPPEVFPAPIDEAGTIEAVVVQTAALGVKPAPYFTRGPPVS